MASLFKKEIQKEAVLWIRIGSGSRRANTPVKYKTVIEFHLLKYWILYSSLDVLYEGLGICKLQFLIKKENKKLSAIFFSIFGHQNPGSGCGTGYVTEPGFT
jgi:hypothetical protein